MHDTVITDGKVVLEDGIKKVNIYLNKGKISKISTDTEESKENISAKGMYVFPGAVDPHVHLNEPGLTYRDDFNYGSKAAAAGGVTTLLEMPNSKPVTDNVNTFNVKLELANEKSIVDFGLYMALTPGNSEGIEELIKVKPIAFKTFMSYSPSVPMIDDKHLLTGMSKLSEVGGLLAVHCENEEMISSLTNKLKNMDMRTDTLAYAESRPPISEWESVQRAINFAEFTGVRIHIVHSSTIEGAEIVKAAKHKGLPVTVETAPHYLLFTLEDFENKGPLALCKPPIRDKETKERLWEFLKNKDIDFLGSDHSAHLLEDKMKGSDYIWNAPPGFSGIQTMVPMILQEGIRRNFDLEHIAKLISTNPAKAFGIFPKKGVIRERSDADLFLYDPKEEWEVKKSNLLYKQKWTPYEKIAVKGGIKRTILRGETIFYDDNGNKVIPIQQGYGNFIPGNYSI